MWHTNCGDRTLDGAEAGLFAKTLWDDESTSDLDDFQKTTVRQAIQEIRDYTDWLIKWRRRKGDVYVCS